MATRAFILLSIFTLHMSCAPVEVGSDTNSIVINASGCAPELHIRSGDRVREDTDEGDLYKSVGLLEFKVASIPSLCSGTLVAPNVVLTADHCVQTSNVLHEEITFQPEPELDPVPAKEVILWDAGAPFRDVALVILESSFDETNPYYSIQTNSMQAAHAPDYIRMVGFGGYTDGDSLASYSIGDKRLGNASFNGYINATYAGDSQDYMEVLPGENGEQIICKGDSGSSSYLVIGQTHLISGVTSLGSIDVSQAADPSNPTSAELCQYVMSGLYVPASQVRDWVYQKIKKHAYKKHQAPNYSTILSATVQEVILDDQFSEMVVSGVNFHDYSSEDLDFDALIISEQSVVVGSLEPGDEIIFYGNHDNTFAEEGEYHLVATKITPLDQPQISHNLSFVGTIQGEPRSRELYGRKETVVTLSNITTEEESSIPLSLNGTEVILCSEGCSEDTANLAATDLTEGQGLAVSGDYINGHGFYARYATNAITGHQACSGE